MHPGLKGDGGEMLGMKRQIEEVGTDLRRILAKSRQSS